MLVGLLAIGLGLIGDVGSAAAASLEGTWSGGGIISPNGGKKEKARCRLTFKKYSERSYKIFAKCSTPSLGVVKQEAVVKKAGSNRYSGHFYSKEYNVRGRISINVKGEKQTVSLKAEGGTALFYFKKTSASAKLD